MPRQLLLSGAVVALLSVGIVSAAAPESGGEVPKRRIAFYTDVQIAPGKGGKSPPHVGVWNDRGKPKYKIPANALQTLRTIGPDVIFDLGDMTSTGTLEEWRTWERWADALPVFPVGVPDSGHDKNNCDTVGFYRSGYLSESRTLRMGNLVFICLPLTGKHGEDWICEQRQEWLGAQLDRYARGSNNVFLLHHMPLYGTTRRSTTWAGMDGDWKRTTKEVMKRLAAHEDHVVAWCCGHVHTPPTKMDYYLDGAEKASLPDLYFLNFQALNAYHGAGPKGYDPVVYWADFRRGAEQIALRFDDVMDDDMRTLSVSMDHRVRLGKGRLRFLESDLGLRKWPDKHVRTTEDAWFKVDAGEKATVTFQKRFADRVDVSAVEPQVENGRCTSVEYRGSSDEGKSWSRWRPLRPVSPPPERGSEGKSRSIWRDEARKAFNVVQLRVRFQAEPSEKMKVREIKVSK